MNVCERRSKIHVPTIEQADDVGMISLQESHTKGIAKPGTALTDANSEGCNLEVLMLKVGFGDGTEVKLLRSDLLIFCVVLMDFFACSSF